MIARYYDADYTLIAHSGRGAARNYGDSVRVSKVTMKDRMLNTFDEDLTHKWNFKGYRPDLVVINLGSNDFSTEPHPYKSEFTKAYKQILAQLREHYGDIPILCIYRTTDLGAAWHPGYSGHKKMAMWMIPYISTIMGWDLTDRVIE